VGKGSFYLVSDAIVKVVEQACRLKEWDLSTIVEREGLGRHFRSSFKGSLDVDGNDREARRAVVGQRVSDARVALLLATRALRGFSKNAAHTQDLREAQRPLSDLIAQDIEEDPPDHNGPEIRHGTARDRILSTTGPEMRHGHKSHEPPRDCRRLPVVRGWSHEQAKQILPRSQGTGRSNGFRAPGRTHLAVGDHPVDHRKDRLFGGDAANSQ